MPSEKNPASPQSVESGFVHLHLHSEYSLLDGGNRISRLLDHVKKSGMDAVALTDHGNLHGAIEFYQKARERGLRPIMGIEAYVAVGSRTYRSPGGIADGGFHLVLLAENNTGWKNLMRLSSDAFLNGFYYKPRMDHSTLESLNEGIIAINGHLGSSLAYHLLKFATTGQTHHWDSAIEEAKWHAATFAPTKTGEPRFFVEVQRTEVGEQDLINPLLIQLAKELNLPVIGDNDAHYLTREDYDMHDSLCCIAMGKMKSDTSRIRYSRELYVKTPQEMRKVFKDLPEAMDNTVSIARRCNVDIDFEANHAPIVRVDGPAKPPEYSGGDLTEWYNAYCRKFELKPFDGNHANADSEQDVRDACDLALRNLGEAGLIWRYGAEGITPEIRERFDRELKVLSDKGISAYFLICWDFVNWARQQGIPASARGSGVGTMIGYTLALSNACPVQYGLLFERFTDPDRTEYPDIDIDICQDGRAAVIDYVRKKYGHVAQIITFGRLKARAALKDVARVSGWLPADGQRLANLVPNELNITLDQAIKKSPDLKTEYESNPSARGILDTAQQLENHARHAGIHAAGVVIATQPLETIVPLCRASGSEDAVTQWDGPTCEHMGLLKMDFLGLRTLSTIERAKSLIREELADDIIWQATGRTDRKGPHPLDFDHMSFEDHRVLDVFRRGDTSGVFQFESGGMRRLLQEMKPDRFEDLIAANSLYRPGPMDLIPDYCNRKHGKQKVPTIHEIVDKFTAETYGIMVYQEQVMQILHELGGVPLRAAYTVIKAISKKKHATIDAERAKFINGAKEKGLEPKSSGDLFDLILKFAGYGFNKSHSTSYAIIAYQTAFLKTYFPSQYMAALLTFESAARKTEDWAPYLEECKHTQFPDHTKEKPHIGVMVLPPDLNQSLARFAVTFEEGEPRDHLHGRVRFGIGAIKNVGAAAINHIIKERAAHGSYQSLFDLCTRADPRVVTKSTIEAMIKAGCLDSIHGTETRAAMLAALDDAVSAGQEAAADRRNGQMSIFGGGDEGAEDPNADERPLPDVQPWTRIEALGYEREFLGFHLSGHPLDIYKTTIEHYCNAATSDLASLQNGEPITIAGMLTRVRTLVTKSGRSAGQKMAILGIQDKVGLCEGVVFSAPYRDFGELLQVDALLVLQGKVDLERGEPQVIVDHVYPIERAPLYLTQHIEIDFISAADSDVLERSMRSVADLIKRSNGHREGSPVDVFLKIEAEGQHVVLRSDSMRAVADESLIRSIGGIIGHENVRAVAGRHTRSS